MRGGSLGMRGRSVKRGGTTVGALESGRDFSEARVAEAARTPNRSDATYRSTKGPVHDQDQVVSARKWSRLTFLTGASDLGATVEGDMSNMYRLVDQGMQIRQDHEADPAHFRPFLAHDHAGRAGKAAASQIRPCRTAPGHAGPHADMQDRTRTCRTALGHARPHPDMSRAAPGHADGTPLGRPVGREPLRRARTPWRPQVRSGERL
jgi:hypothetical protein